MKLAGEHGETLDAELDLEAIGNGRLAVTLDSAGGMSGTQRSRNRDYPLTLETLLRRLAMVDAVLEDVLVDSRNTRTLTPRDRRIQPLPWSYPIQLGEVADFDLLRKAITRPQGNIGSTAARGGNERKRIRLTFVGPTQVDLAQIEEILQVVRSSLPRRSAVSDGLTGADVTAALDEWQRIGRDAFMDKYGGRPAQKYVIVEGGSEFDAMAILRGARTIKGIDSAGPLRGDRRSVADPLRAMGFVVDNLESDQEGPLGPDPQRYARWTGTFSGDTDGMTIRSYRREQRFLRGVIGIGTGDPNRLHQCGICGRSFPEQLLAAAHVKPRRECTDEERRDLFNVAMPACTLGCDALYEHGYLAVSARGELLCDETASVDLSRYDGLIAPAWTLPREPYFAWHRVHSFLGARE
ncbi:MULTISPECIES: hypothetical protein [unclassified Kribbella]|uniref:hypothetical protein n=1 Tax=unclassified Kribbella TaxID=2644121 RepID=UPI003018C003